MNLSKDFSHLKKCPKTREILYDNEILYSSGVCPKCGDVQRGTVTHYYKQSGRWNVPSLLEWFKGVRSEFIPLEDEQ